MNKIPLQEVEKKIIQGITEMMSVDNITITPETSLLELGIDSLGLVEIFVFIEKNFNLQLLESGLTKEDIKSIHSLAAYVDKRI